MVDDLEIGRADGDGVDAHQDFRLFRHWDGLLAQRKLPGIAEHPRLHGIRDRVIRTRLDSGWRVHLGLLPRGGPYPLLARMWAQAQSIRRQISAYVLDIRGVQ